MRALLWVVLAALGEAAWGQGDNEVRLRLVDALTNAPVAKVQVKVWDDSHPFLSEEASRAEAAGLVATSDEQGIVAFAGLADGKWTLRLPDLYVTRRVCQADAILRVTAGNRGELREIRTVENGRLRVTVRYADLNRPVPFAAVRFEALPWEGPNPLPWRSEPIEAMSFLPHTDEQGQVERSCSPGRYGIWAEPVGMVPTEHVEAIVEPGGVCEAPVLLVDPSAAYPRVLGHVRNQSGQDVEGATVAVRKVNPTLLKTAAFTVPDETGQHWHTSRTSTEGVYEIRDARSWGYHDMREAEGPFGIAVLSDKHAIDWIDMPEPQIGDAPRVIDFVLRSPVRVSVGLRDRKTGKRIEGDSWAIDLYWRGRERGEGPLRWLLRPDEEGTIRLNGCPPGECRWELMRVTETDHWGVPTAWGKVAEGTASVTYGEGCLIRAEVDVP
ncbi:MAG: hypothetical protein FJX75_03945 [Armatimonadetes bacterium]|nr:hypothetical protein [Armatimonadota bacterium]